MLFNGVPAPLVSVQSNQIEFQAPFELEGMSTATIEVTYNDQLSNVFTAALAPSNLSILAVANADGTANSAANPARVGSVATVYINGVGQTNPPGVDGGINPNNAGRPVNLLTVDLNAAPIAPAFLGSAAGESTAVFQINLVVTSGGSLALDGANGFIQTSTMLYAQ